MESDDSLRSDWKRASNEAATSGADSSSRNSCKICWNRSITLCLGWRSSTASGQQISAITIIERESGTWGRLHITRSGSVEEIAGLLSASQGLETFAASSGQAQLVACDGFNAGLCAD